MKDRVGLSSRETPEGALVVLPGDDPLMDHILFEDLSLEVENQGKGAVADRVVQDAEISQAEVSSCGDVGGHGKKIPCPSSAIAASGSLLHDLSNLVGAVLLNANLLGWKLPPHSHLKRPVKEIERNAQRAGELLRQLTARCNSATGHLPPMHASRG